MKEDITKEKLAEVLFETFREVFREEPTVEITEPQPNLIQIRVKQDSGGPRYFTIKVSEFIS